MDSWLICRRLRRRVLVMSRRDRALCPARVAFRPDNGAEPWSLWEHTVLPGFR